MNQEDFKRQIEYPMDRLLLIVTNSQEANLMFWIRNIMSSTIARSIRLCLKHPDLAKEYLESLPKAAMD
jgi:hypothetical protein